MLLMRFVGLNGPQTSRLVKSPILRFGTQRWITSFVNKKNVGLNIFESLQQNPNRFYGFGRPPKITNWGVRQFHQSKVKNIFNGRGLDPKQKVTVIKVNPLIIFISFAFTLTLVLMFLPILLSAMFPIIIATIAFVQFRRWNRNQMATTWLNALKTTHLKVRAQVTNAMRMQAMQKIFRSASRQGNDTGQIFQSVIQALDRNETMSSEVTAEVNAFKEFVEARVMEALAKDEKGMRTKLFKGIRIDNVEFQGRYPLKLNFDEYSHRDLVRNGSPMLEFTFLLTSNFKNRKPIGYAKVSLVMALTMKNMETPMITFKNADENMNYIIALQPLKQLVSKVFVIDTPGETGDYFKKFSKRTRPDGHTEYTVY